jgi:putative ATP-binding cassette transporter
VNAYQELALWRASIERLLTFREAMEIARARIARPGAVRIEASDLPSLQLRDLHLELPDGRALLDVGDASIGPGESVAVVGPSGAGQTTLLRALAGRWPFGTGSIAMPAGGHAMFLSPHPYLPIATLRAAVSYPSPEGRFGDETIRAALRRVDLESLADRLDDSDHWEKRLSDGEQQRLAIARILLHEPEWIFLDDATAALDEETERRAYAALLEQLPRATIVSIAHRPAVVRYHARRWTLVARPDGRSELEAA